MGCVCAGTGRALSNEQHIHLMGLTFNQSTYSLSPTCLKNIAHQWDRKWHALAHVCECPSRGPLTVDLLHSTITTRGVARIWEMRKGCGPLRTLPLMKTSELVELVGLASLVSYHISPYLVHLSFWVTCASWKWLVLVQRCRAEVHVDRTPDLGGLICSSVQTFSFCKGHILCLS